MFVYFFMFMIITWNQLSRCAKEVTKMIEVCVQLATFEHVYFCYVNIFFVTLLLSVISVVNTRIMHAIYFLFVL